MSKKSKNRSAQHIPITKSEPTFNSTFNGPTDVLTVRILKLLTPGEEHLQYTVKVIFFDQVIAKGKIISIPDKPSARTSPVTLEKSIACGVLHYEPSNYERMCLYANTPLIVQLTPIYSPTTPANEEFSPGTSPSASPDTYVSTTTSIPKCDIYCCNIDILPIFIDKEIMKIEKRMQPMMKPPILLQRSWDSLPLLTVELSVLRNELNEANHDVLKNAGFMKFTVIGAYNLIIPYDDDHLYTVATKTPLSNDSNYGTVIFNHGLRLPERFNSLSFYPRWEHLRADNSMLFTKSDEKFVCKLENIINASNIDLKYYMAEERQSYVAIWGSFQRTLMLNNSEEWLMNHMRQYLWPLELHLYGKQGGYSFMAGIDLFKLLYPGETTARIAVPLEWINAFAMSEKCGCEGLLAPNVPSVSGTYSKGNKTVTTDSIPASISCDDGTRPTGFDGNNAFVIIEVQLARPLLKPVIPPVIGNKEINDMLKAMELGVEKRDCSGRGQSERDFLSMVRACAYSLKKVPHYGAAEFCAFNRQLSETRTRVELSTSAWMEAAIYVNNNFVVQDFLKTNETFEEMLMMTHACLVKKVQDTLMDEKPQEIDPVLRAARHARQLRDIPHAVNLYLQYTTQNTHNSDAWRELGVCMLDYDPVKANICISKSVALNPRHRLSLLCKGGILFGRSPEAAEPFFAGLVSLHPYWLTGLIAAHIYYVAMEKFYISDKIIEFIKECPSDGVNQETLTYRDWEADLGDWWEPTPMTPGASRYYEPTDVLLRLRCLSLAEVCISRSLAAAEDSAPYYHLVAMCCRLRGDVDNALCHARMGLEKFGEVTCLRILEAECLTYKNVIEGMAAFEKCNNSCVTAFSILLSQPSRDPLRARSALVDLLRRQPNAYAWIALAEDWLVRKAAAAKAVVAGDTDRAHEQTGAETAAIACATQALKYDRLAGRAWQLLSKLVEPQARKVYCRNMAIYCGYHCHELTPASSDKTVCYRTGTAFRGCRCQTCEPAPLPA